MKILLVSVSIAVLLAGAGIFYYFVVALPRIEKAKIATKQNLETQKALDQAWERTEKLFLESELQSCLEHARTDISFRIEDGRVLSGKKEAEKLCLQIYETKIKALGK